MLGIENVPRTVGCIQPFILLTFIVATRLIAYSFLNSKVKAKTGSDEKRNVLIYGTGSNARGLAEALEDDAECHVVGFLDSDPSLEGRRVSRLRVFAIRDLEAIFYGWNCHEVILTVADSSDDHDQEIVNRLIASQIPFRCLPSITRPIQHRDHGESYNDLDEEASCRRIIRPKVDRSPKT